MTVSDFVKNLKNKKIHIVGLSSSEGSAIALFLSKNGIQNSQIIAHDFCDEFNNFKRSFNNNHVAYSKEEKEIKLNNIINLNLKLFFKNDYLHNIENADIIFVSQNWFNYSCNFPYLQNAQKKNITFMNITELYFTLVPCPIIAVTGSNGKTTTSNLIYQILKSTPDKTFFTGNDRYAKQILEDINLITANDKLVMEISNRQLINFKSIPQIAVITNVLPNHIDEHGSYENYIETKFNLFANQTSENFAVINFDNPITYSFSSRIKSKILPFSRKTIFKENGIYENNGIIFLNINGKINSICDINEINLQGEHNIENTLAAIGGSFLAGANITQIKKAIKEFTGVKNRIELIRKINDISYYNDLASTSPQATIAALQALKNNIILIAGGHDKGMDYKELSDEIKLRVKKLILLPGRGTEKIISYLNGFNYIIVSSIAEALDITSRDVNPGDNVLLSPACANFYSLYIDNKEGFNKLVKKLKK